MAPKISIITPAYNHEEFLPSCIESVLNQTYQLWEQIIIDDASQDQTFNIAKSYAEKDKRIILIKHKKNWGIRKLAGIYNQALRQASGNFVAILESDDFWPSNKLEKQIKCFNDKKVALSFGDCLMTNSHGQPIKLFTYNFQKG